MNVDFKVHTVALVQSNAKAVVEGEEVQASVKALEVELTTVAERNGTLVLRFTGSSIEGAKELFTKDAVISASFTKAPNAQA